MNTLIYNAKNKKPIVKVYYGVGDVVSLHSEGGIYPNYDEAYHVFGKEAPRNVKINSPNLFRVVGFLLHSCTTNKSGMMVAVENSKQFFITTLDNIIPRPVYNTEKKDYVDIVYVNNIATLRESVADENEIMSEIRKICPSAMSKGK